MPIDVEKIMSEIRCEIEQRGYTKAELVFADIENEQHEGLELLGDNFVIDNFSQMIVKMDEKSYVQCWRPLKGNKLIVFLKKIIRKCVKFYVEPIVENQNEFNHNTVSAMAMTFSKFDSMRDEEIAAMEKKIEQLEQRCQKLEKMLEEK